MIRVFASLLLAMVVALTSVTTAQARHMDAAVDRMVICTGLQTSVIYIDAQGNPTQSPHACPDCMVAAPDMLAVASFELRTAPVVATSPDAPRTIAAPDRPNGTRKARAPPVAA